MTYDNWKATNPQDEFLGPDPREERDQYDMGFEGSYYMHLISLHDVKDENDLQRQKRLLSNLLEAIRAGRTMPYDN